MACSPVVFAKLTGSARVTPFCCRILARTSAGLAPVWTSTCQSIGTRAIALTVIFDVVEDSKVPIEASSATPTATPRAVEITRLRRWASNPRSHVSETMLPPSGAW